MAEQYKDLYAASCNPARRAKHSRADDPAQIQPKKPNPPPDTSNSLRNVLPILPKRSAQELPQETNIPSSVPQPARAKRGRKPGPLSRTARETQRKLNHSIIEKARRTKINEALATLRELVPKDYGYSKDKPMNDNEGEDDEEKPGKTKFKATGKREEKEKEFKLEILVRTVSFMQDLLARVQAMEANTQQCSKCAANDTSKRKRDHADEGTNDNADDHSIRPPKRINDSRDIQTSAESPLVQRSSSIESTTARAYFGSRLPSISSWLPPSQIDPALLSPSQRPLSNNTYQLPSPPSSTIFHPIQTSHAPPALNLGPVATSSLLSPLRTPEDESAASLLLQISASSPQLLPISISNSCTSFDLSKLRTVCRTPGKPVEHMQAQTPGTMLGLMQKQRG